MMQYQLVGHTLCWRLSLCHLQGSDIIAENCHNSNGVFQGYTYHSRNTDGIPYDPLLLRAQSQHGLSSQL